MFEKPFDYQACKFSKELILKKLNLKEEQIGGTDSNTINLNLVQNFTLTVNNGNVISK